MPTIYKYFGIYFFFWSNEHHPIHVHAKFQGAQCVVLVYGERGRLKVEVKNIRGKKRMDKQNLKKIKRFAEKYKDKIVEKWEQYHIYDKAIKTEVINRKVK